MPQTVLELGQKVKQKYPGQYDDLPDDEVGRRVKSKFPGQYDDFADTGPAGPPRQPSLMDRAASYLPSPHTIATVGGAAIGGAIGGLGGTVLGTPLGAVPGAALGGAAGASIGESVYQLGSHLMGSPDAPQTGGESLRENMKAQIQGGMQEALPAIVNTKLPGALERSAARNIEQTVRPMGMGAKEAVQEAAPQVARDYPIAASSSGLRLRVGDISKKANDAVNAAYQGVSQRFRNTRFDGAKLADLVESRADQYVLNGQPIVGKESQVSAYKEIADWLRQNKNFSIEDFRKVKQNWDDVINWNRFSDAATKDPAKAQAMETASNMVRDTIHKTFPSLAKADKESSLWATMSAAAKASDIRGVGSEPIQKLLQRHGLAAGAGAGIGYSTGNDPWKGAVIGGMLAGLPQTVLWDTLEAGAKAQLIRFLESQAGQGIVNAGAVTGSMALSPRLEKARQLRGAPTQR